MQWMIFGNMLYLSLHLLKSFTMAVPAEVVAAAVVPTIVVPEEQWTQLWLQSAVVYAMVEAAEAAESTKTAKSTDLMAY